MTAPYVSGCWIIGEFPSKESAHQAVETISYVLNQIERWHKAHDHEDVWQEFWASGDWLEKPTPIEKQLADEYGLEWQSALSWTSEYSIEILLERLVVIRPGWGPDSTGEPINTLMEKLGGKGYIHWSVRLGYDLAWILYDVRCSATDENAAMAIYNRYIGFHRRIRRNERQLHFYRWRFDEMPNFFELIKELQDLEFTNISYSLTQYDLEDPPFRLHDQTDVDVLLAIIAISTYSEDVEQSIKLLGEFRTVRAVPLLIEALTSEDVSVQRAASNALGRIRDSRAVAPLILALEKAHELLLQPTIIRVLSGYNTPDAINALVNKLHDDRIWEAAANALGAIGPAALSAVAPLLQSSDEAIRQRASTTVSLIEETMSIGSTLEALRSINENTRNAAFETLVQPPIDTETLLAYLRNPGAEPDVILQNRIIDTLVESHDLRVIDVLAERVLYLGGKAIHRLMTIGSPAIDALIQLYQSHPEEWVRDSSLWAIVQIGDKSVIEPLLNVWNRADEVNKRKIQSAIDKLSETAE